jgi:Ser/Thr protein kinase RdoA (MazF antagonist)
MVSVSELEAVAVADAFDLGADARMGDVVARGEQGYIRRLDTDRGAFAVKESFDGADDDDAEAAAGFQARCHEAGVPCPRPVPDREGRFLSVVDGVAVRLLTWVDLVDPDPLLDPQVVGETLARLHAVPTPGAGEPHPWHTEPVGAEEWRALVKASRAGGAPFAHRLAALVPDLLAAEALLTPMRSRQVLHLDLWADNLRSEPDGNPCVIDFDNAGPGDPDRELAMVLFEFGRDVGPRIRTLAAAYAESGGAGRVTRREDFGLPVAQLHHIGRCQIRGWLAARDPEARARAHAAVEEFVHEPLTVAWIDRILDELGA